MTSRQAQRQAAGDVPPPWFDRAPGLRVDRHRATMAHLASVYPCHTDTSIGERGPYIGVNITGGGSGCTTTRSSSTPAVC